MNIIHLHKFLILFLIFLTACSSTDERPEYRERSLAAIYNNAVYNLDRGRLQQAAFEFDEVERQHPYSSWARRSMLMSAYAYYLIGQSYYERIQDVARDQRITELALESFVEVVRRYPDTDYAKDSQLKIDLTLDHLAGKEMYIGRYYLKKKAFLAAINRFRTVTVDYQTTSHAPEALHRTVEAYISMGLLDEAYNTAAVLGHNFPNSSWYKDSYELIKGNVK